MEKMKKYKIVRFKDLGNWFVYRRYLLFLWSQENYFITLDAALEYVGKQLAEIIDEQPREDEQY